MTRRRFRIMHDDRGGFTLLELIIAIAIAALITAGITAAIMQILTINHRASNHMVVVRQVQQAGKEVSKDTLQSQNVTYSESSGFNLTLAWKNIEGLQNLVSYTISPANELSRSHSVNGTPVATAPPIVAEYMDPDQTNCVWNATKRVLIFTVTAALGTESETRIYEIEPRPSPPSS
ncbi:MAG: prepilin-type N-terminal cleavage/methylation domain-containing protein [Dehalococcoidia bacterium]|nr:prepilin-type N-terminal cleavage/methylation domain-containing protein [Dehalococcoidia bacterium]